MTERTSPTDAIERLSWVLNYVGEGPRSLNELSEKSDLSWATVRKYIQVIETVQKVAPKISIEEDGVYVGARSSTLKELFEDPAVAMLVYLFTQAEMKGDASKPIDRQACKNLNSDLGGVLDQLVELGWVEESEEEIQLTPTGMQVAGPARSEVLNSKQDISGEGLTIRRKGSKEIVALKDDLGQGQDSEKSTNRTLSGVYADWGEYYDPSADHDYDGKDEDSKGGFDTAGIAAAHS